MKIDKNEVHIWSTSLAISANDLEIADTLLSPDERSKAARFQFPLHRQRYIAAHIWLRRILSLYLNMPPAAISFSYSEHNKPCLPAANALALRFNLSHSSDMAACAITSEHSIGMDIEKIETINYHDLAKRFFSQEEFNLLMKSPEHDRTTIFYTIWVRKEAILKATGKGLSIPLNKFTVTLQESLTHIDLDNQSWSLLPLSIHPDYPAALAISYPVKIISYWEWQKDHPKLCKEEII